ncbi:MAG: OmpA family protein [Pyrinomonadaceae bacterium MAG19_C2-C3]|nr:OmpA family protein [Pyrinomonadaceae bacterium MAG19_C2-C3]
MKFAKHKTVWRVMLGVCLTASMSVATIAASIQQAERARQSDTGRQTVAVTYPLDETINVRFRGTTRLPRLKGEAKVKRTGRRNTRVEMNIDGLPRASEVGEVFTTYILWAISPEGRIDNLGEIKRSGSFIFNTKIDVTTPLQTFALIVTAEPHFLVRAPSRAVVLENLPPVNPGNAGIATVDVRYIGNSSDYYETARVPEVADADYAKTPVSLLGARQALNLARFAGAGRDAREELRQAETDLENAENAWRLKQPESEIDALARNATSLSVRAEELAVARRASRERLEETTRRDSEVRAAERTAANATTELEQLKAQLALARRDRELTERDLANANEQLREQRSEVARLREEIQTIRTNAEESRLTLARIEGERQAEQTRLAEARRQQEQRAAMETLRASLSRYGTVRDTPRGMTVVLPDTIFTGVRTAQLNTSVTSNLDPLAALLAANPNLGIIVEAFADNRGEADALQQLTDERARAVAFRMSQSGIENARIQANGMGTSNPVAANTTLATRARNRRIEITIFPRGSAVDSAASSASTGSEN